MLPLTALAALLLLQPPTTVPAVPPLTLPVPATTPAAPEAKWSDTLKGKWQGTIEIPGGATLGFILTVKGTADAAVAIPDQGLPETPLTDVAITAAAMKFKLVIPGAPAAANPVWDLQVAPDGTTAKGTMLQSGMTLTASVKKLADGEDGGPKRPQTPKPPFRYTTREVRYESFDGAAINGTLTIPAEATLGKVEARRYPCVLFITGSGTQDRDETLFHHKPFAVIADTLALAGIASLRVDDRGLGGAKDPLGVNATSETFAQDVAAGIDYLGKQSEIDPARIGLLGHSEGGLIAPAVAAAKREKVAFIVMLAGTGVTGREVLERQLAAILLSQGATPQQVTDAANHQRATLTAAAAGNEAAARQSIVDAIKASDPLGQLTGPALDSAVDNAMKQAFSPWMRHFLTRDPRPDLRKTRCPVLVLNGGKDIQVIADQNVPEIMKALLEGGNANVTARVYPNLNHLFQPVGETGTGGIDGYAKIETTIDPVVLETITAWIKGLGK